MIFNSIKNFFKNIIYVFVPMGIFYLGVLLTLFFFIENFLGAISLAGTNLVAVINENFSNGEIALKDFIDYASSQINWNNNIYEIVDEIMSKDRINSTINGFLNTIEVSTSEVSNEVNLIINDFMSQTQSYFITSIVFLIISILVATIITRIVIFKETVKETFKEKLLGYIIRPIILLVIIYLMVVINKLIGAYTIIVLFLYLMLDAYFSLFSSYLIYKNKDLKLKTVMNLKNASTSLISSALIIVFTIILSTLFSLINLTLGVLITIPLVIYSINIMSINAESYVKKLSVSTK